jgi:60 kDa SS-A/Ro ribonucleoprotein
MVNNLKVSEALLAHMPLGATLRNLSRFTANGLIKPLSASAKLVVERLSDAEAIERSRIHPVNALNALKTYHQGHGIKGSLVWTPVNTVSDALEEMFYATFKTVQPSGKATMLALDVSGSMEWDYCAGSVLSPREASAVMAMVTARCEESYQFMAFSQGFTPLPITATDSLNQVIQKMKGIPFNGTDCSVPMTWALEHKIPVETFVVYTDNETWAGKIHPFQALKNFRDKMGIPAKLIVVGMVSNGFTIADPSDAGMLDVVGFDSNAPALIADFAADRF